MRWSDHDYEGWLAWCRSSVGGRHPEMFKIIIAARVEGIDDETIAHDLATCAGDPPLDPDEIAAALVNCDFRPDGACDRDALIRAADRRAAEEEAFEASITERQRSYVRECIAEGERIIAYNHPDLPPMEWLTPFSPVMCNPNGLDYEDPRLNAYHAKTFVGTLYDNWDDSPVEGYLLTVPKQKTVRTRGCLHTPQELTWKIEDWKAEGKPLPQYVAPNLFSGEGYPTQKGYESFGVKKAVAHRRWALIEFDKMPMTEQFVFWVGLINLRPDTVATVTHSRNKSLHGIVRVYEAESGDVEERERVWLDEWKELRRYFCSDPDERYRCDLACKDSSRLSRLPGGTRISPDRPGDGLAHILLYANPNAAEV